MQRPFTADQLEWIPTSVCIALTIYSSWILYTKWIVHGCSYSLDADPRDTRGCPCMCERELSVFVWLARGRRREGTFNCLNRREQDRKAGAAAWGKRGGKEHKCN